MSDSNLVITPEKIKEVLLDNLDKILTDVFTGYDSPIKKMFESDEFKTALQKIAKETFSEIVAGPEFKDQLKDKLLEKAVANMMR